MKSIAVLTSGGDAPGMNAAIRSVVRVANSKGMDVYGIRDGYKGMIDGNMHLLKTRDVSGIALKGGTILHTARCLEFQTPEGRERAVKNLKALGIDGVVAIGGDGTFHGALELSKLGIPTIGIPGTIDNDLAYTDFTIGFDTALNTIVSSIRMIRDTMESHSRVGVVEVMGRHCGDLALFAAAATGAVAAVVPEFPYDIQAISDHLRNRYAMGVEHGIIVLAEGVGHADEFANELRELSGLDIRATVLGHIQRGGDPTATDATLAARMGGKAVELLHDGIGNRVVGIKNNSIRDYDIEAALEMKPKLHKKLVTLISELAL